MLQSLNLNTVALNPHMIRFWHKYFRRDLTLSGVLRKSQKLVEIMVYNNRKIMVSLCSSIIREQGKKPIIYPPSLGTCGTDPCSWTSQSPELLENKLPLLKLLSPRNFVITK